MAEQGFLSRWSRLKAEAREAPDRRQPGASVPEPAQAPAVHAPRPANPACAPGPSEPADRAGPQGLPTLEDALRLGRDSDYSSFVARGVDPSVRRQALRTLFTDPHFNVIDGLDVYMGDYTKADPMPPAMLASLQQANAWLRKQVNDEPAAPAHPDGTAATQQDHDKATAPPRAPAREHDEH